MKQWFTLTDLAAANLPDLPRSPKSLDKVARQHWRGSPNFARKVPGKTKSVWEYHISLLPKAAQTRLHAIHVGETIEADKDIERRKAELWDRFETLSNGDKTVCEQRLQALVLAGELEATGLLTTEAMKFAAKKAGVSVATLYNWQALTHNVDREDWLAALAPSFAKSGDRASCDPRAWSFLKSDYLRAEAPAFSECYRRTMTAAGKEGWEPIPSERTLRRLLDAEVPEAVQTLARKGKEKAKQLFPAQRRVRAHLHAMQMVNMDGHKLDVFVKVPWSEKPVRMFMLGIQDLYSGKILSWRISDSENKETVRLVIGDMVERFGIPDAIVLDNGRAFASKWISGGAETRFRFKVRDEDPEGLLVALGIKPHWTLPYSGQSKPIERAWRDLAEKISKHPFCAGAYVGNKPDAKPENYGSRAVPLEGFRMHVAEQIAAHNAQAGRTGGDCRGRSFDETFTSSMADPATIVNWPTNAQKSLWLLASEVITAKKGTGEIHFQGNRYWSRELNQFAGKKVTVRFDPDSLHEPIKVYDLQNQLICEAECIEDAGFNDVDAARIHARRRAEYRKALAAQEKAHAALSAQQLADILYKGNVPAPEPEPVRPKVTRLVTGNLAIAQPVSAISEEDFENSFSRALSRISGGGASVIEFPQGNGPASSASGSQSAEPKSSEYGSGKKKGGRNPAR